MTGEATVPAAVPLRVKPSLRAAASTFARVASYLLVAAAAPLLVAVLAGRSGVLAAIVLAEFSFFAVVPAAAALLIPAVRLAFTRYDLDEDGVRVHSDLVSRSDQRVPWDKVTLLVQRRSLIDRILGISSIDVVAYGTRGTTLHLVGLHDPAAVRTFAAQRMLQAASVQSLFRND